MLQPRMAWLVGGALVVMAITRFIPLAIGPLVMTTAGVVALWPLAYTLWTHPAAQHRTARVMPTTSG